MGLADRDFAVLFEVLATLSGPRPVEAEMPGSTERRG
jgi:hypothetical protein